MMLHFKKGESGRTLAVLLGLAVAFAALVRPDNLVFFAVILLVTAAFAIRFTFIPSRAVLACRLLLVCLLIATSAAPPIVAWMTCNYIGTGRFRMTNMMGLHMSQPVYNMFDQVDPEDEVRTNGECGSHEQDDGKENKIVGTNKCSKSNRQT